MRKQIAGLAKSVFPARPIKGLRGYIRGAAAFHHQPAAIGGFCLVIFLADAFTLADGLASALYILVVVWFAERWQRGVVLAASAACIILTLATYPLAHGFVTEFDPIFRRIVSCAAIVITTPLILLSLRLRAELSRQDTFLDMTNHPIIMRDKAGGISYWNGSAERLYGWKARDAIGQNVGRLLGTAFVQPLLEIEAAFEAQGFWEGKSINRTRSGASVTVLNRWFGQASENDGDAVLDIATDITALQEVTARLQSSEERYRSIFNTINIAILEHDFSAVAPMIEELRGKGVSDFDEYCGAHPDFIQACIRAIRLVDVNECAVTMFDAAGKAELLRSLAKIYLPETIAGFVKIIPALARGEAFFTMATSARTLAGRRLSVLVSVNLPGTMEQMNSVFVSVVDDTERRNIQESLSETRERLARVRQVVALGDMTATIAHQVNHPLAAIIANSEAALRWLNRPEPEYHEAAEAIDAALQNGNSAARVVKNIRSFGAYDAAQNSLFSIVQLCEDSCRLLGRELTRNDISVRRQFAHATTLIFGDKIQIEQVILNLMSNAIEALSNSTLPRELTIRAGSAGESGMHIEIEDNGSGISEAAMAKLFTPFYTTKASGMGLGLAICRAIVAFHDGKIWAKSAAGQGTTVCFTLPVATPAVLSAYL